MVPQITILPYRLVYDLPRPIRAYIPNVGQMNLRYAARIHESETTKRSDGTSLIVRKLSHKPTTAAAANRLRAQRVRHSARAVCGIYGDSLSMHARYSAPRLHSKARCFRFSRVTVSAPASASRVYLTSLLHQHSHIATS